MSCMYLSCVIDSTNHTNFANEIGDYWHKCLFVLLTFVNASQDVYQTCIIFSNCKKKKTL